MTEQLILTAEEIEVIEAMRRGKAIKDAAKALGTDELALLRAYRAGIHTDEESADLPVSPKVKKAHSTRHKYDAGNDDLASSSEHLRLAFCIVGALIGDSAIHIDFVGAWADDLETAVRTTQDILDNYFS